MLCSSSFRIESPYHLYLRPDSCQCPAPSIRALSGANRQGDSRARRTTVVVEATGRAAGSSVRVETYLAVD